MKTQRIIISFVVTILAILSMSGAVLAAEMRWVETTQASTISGIVTNEDGEPVAGVYVNPDPVIDVDQPFSNGITDANGQYTLTLPVGVYRLHFYDGSGTYDDTWYGGETWTEATQLSAPGVPVTGIDVVMNMGGIISGTLSLADDDAWSTTVVLFQQDQFGSWTSIDGQDVQTSTTWAFTQVDAGTYRICGYSGTNGTENTSSRYNRTCYGGDNTDDVEVAADIVVGENARVTGIDLVFELNPYTIMGTVRDESGTPLSGIIVNGYNQTSSQRESSYVLTDENGQYTMRVNNGTHELTFRHEYEQYTHAVQIVDVADGDVSEVDVMMGGNYGIVGMLQLGDTGSISGFVTSYQWVANEYAPDGGEWYSIKTVPASEDEGYFMALPAGTYRICAGSSTYYSAPANAYAGCYGGGRTPADSVDVVFVDGVNTTIDIDFSTYETATLTGIVTDDAGNPLGGIDIIARTEYTRVPHFGIGYAETTTDENGAYSLTLTESDYTLFFRDDTRRYVNEHYDNVREYEWSGMTSMEMVDGETRELDVVLETAGQLSGAVTIDGETLATYGYISLIKIDGEREITVGEYSFMTDTTYLIDGLPAGTYKLCYGVYGYFAGNEPQNGEYVPYDFSQNGCYDGVTQPSDGRDVIINTGESITLNIDVETDSATTYPPVVTNGMITGTVRDTAGNQLPNIEAVLYKAHDQAYLGLSPDSELPPYIIDVLFPTDESGEPIVITATNGFVGAYEWVSTTTDDNGAYAFGSLPDGRYYIGFRDATGQYANTYHEATKLHESPALDIKDGNNFGDIDGEMTLGGNIVGVITLGDLPLEEASAFFENIFIQAVNANEPFPLDVFSSSGTGGGGTYTLTGLPAGEYIISVYLDATNEFSLPVYRSEYHHNAQFSEDAMIVTLAPGETATINFTMDESAVPIINATTAIAHDAWTGEGHILIVSDADVEVTAIDPICSDYITGATFVVDGESETAEYEMAWHENNGWRVTIAASDWISGDSHILWACADASVVQPAGTVTVWDESPLIEEEIVEGEAIPLAVTLNQVNVAAVSITPLLMIITSALFLSSVIIHREKQ